jgi:hypothetical protein
VVGGPVVVKRVEKKTSVAGQFTVKFKSETHFWTTKLNEEDYGVDKYCTLPFTRLRFAKSRLNAMITFLNRLTFFDDTRSDLTEVQVTDKSYKS